MRYTINSPHVIADILEGELIILHLETGKYFSIKGSGVSIWQLIAGGYEDVEAADTLARYYAAERDILLPEVVKLREQFLSDDLLSSLDESAERTEVEINLGVGEVFVEPIVEAYTDMQGLLLLDPIHEVEDRGWPHKAD
jgi:hypothetical protein